MPNTVAYDPNFKSEASDYDPARARALLDLYGYTDRDGDGWRERPDGSPLLLRVNSESQARFRKICEVLVKNMSAIGVRVEIKIGQWPENLKSARAGNYQVWAVGSLASAPDSAGAYQKYDSNQIGGQNMARVRLPRLDALYDRMQLLPDGPERTAVFREAERIALAYMPYKFILNRMTVDMTQKRVIGYRRPVFWQEWWHYVDLDDGPPPSVARA